MESKSTASLPGICPGQLSEQHLSYLHAGWETEARYHSTCSPHRFVSNESPPPPSEQGSRFTRKQVKFSEGSKPTLCKPERSVRVPRIHPQSVSLKSPREGLWETVWMDSKQDKTHLITSFIMNLGFFRAGDNITLLCKRWEGRWGLVSMLKVHLNTASPAGLPNDITQTSSSLKPHELYRPSPPFSRFRGS